MIRFWQASGSMNLPTNVFLASKFKRKCATKLYMDFASYYDERSPCYSQTRKTTRSNTQNNHNKHILQQKCLDSIRNIHPHMSCVVRKPAFGICENKDADQLRGNREADQRLCFRYTDTTIPLFSKSEISSL